MTAPKNNLRDTLLRSALQTGFTYCPAACIAAVATIGSLNAQTISVNLASDQRAVDTAAAANPAGAIPISGEFWNNASGATGTLAAGTIVDETGAVVPGLSIDWSSNNTYFSGAGAATGTSENANLLKGYLDDGGAGWSVTLNNSQFLLSDVYAIRSSDQGDPAAYNPVSIDGSFYTWDGSQTALAVGYNTSFSGQNWTDADALVEGSNFLKIASAPVLTIAGDRGTVGRNPIAGLQIVNAYAGTLAYWDANGLTTGSGDTADGTLDGTWGTDSFWTSDANGELATVAWNPGDAAVFSAGTDGVNIHTITLNGTQVADAVWVQQGEITLDSGILDLSGGLGLLRSDDFGLTVNSQITAGDLTTSGTVTLGNATNTITGTVNVGGITLLLADQDWNQIAGGGETNIDSAATLTIGTSNLDSTYAGNFSGDGNVVKTGTGTLTLLGGSPGMNGTVDIAGGDVVLSNAGGGFTSTISFTGAGDLSFLGAGSSDPSITAGGDLSGFTGAVTIDGARVAANSSGGDRLGSGDITVLSGGQLWVTGGALANNVLINGNGTTEGAGQLGAIRFETGASVAGDVTLQSDSRLTTWAGAVGTLSGALSGAFNLEKTGTGFLVIESTSNSGYTGQTTVSSGRLRLADETSIGDTPASPTADSIILQGGGRIQGGTAGAGGDLTISANRGITLNGGDSGFHTWTGFTTTVESDIVGTGRLTHSDGGSLVVNGDTTLDGSVLAASGTVTFNGDLTATGGPIRVQGASTVNFNSSSVIADGSTNGGSNGGLDLGTGTTNINLGNGAGGLMLLEDWELGQNGSQPHTSNLTAGDVRVENDVRIGHWGGSTSSINISGGSLSLPDTVTSPTNEGQANVFLGIDGEGSLAISGGTLNATSLVLDGRGSTGAAGSHVLSLTGGTLNVGQWGIRNGGANYAIEFGGGVVGTTSSSAEPGYDWSSDWSTSLPIQFTGTNGDTSFQAGAHTITLSGALSGAGGLSVDSGNLVLSGTGTYAGNTAVNGGTLYVNGATGTGASPVTIASGGAIGVGTPQTTGTGTVETLDLQAGSESVFRLSFAAPETLTVNAADGLTVGGNTVTAIPTGQLFIGDTFPIIQYTGTIQGAGFGALSLDPLPNPHYAVSLVDGTVADPLDTTIYVSVDSVDSITWTGSVDGVWDVNSTGNWETDSDLNASNYYDFDQVGFVDGSGNTNLTLVGPITPADVLFNNNTDTFTLSGDGIGGSANLTIAGGGTTILTNDNTYTGETVVSSGTLQIGDGTSGSISTSSTITNDDTLILNLPDGAVNNNIIVNDGLLQMVGSNDYTVSTIGGGTISGSGGMEYNGTGTLTLAGRNSNTGGLTVNSGTVLLTGGGWYQNPSQGTGMMTVEAGATVVNWNSHSYGGRYDPNVDMTLNGGTFQVRSGTYVRDITMNGGTIENFPGSDSQIQARGFGGTDIIVEDAATSSEISCRYFTGEGNSVITVNDPDTDFLMTGAITGDNQLIKNGPGRLLSSATNTHSGNLLITEGTFALAPTGSHSDSPVIDVASGATFDVTAVSGYAISATQTLSGNGTLDGSSFIAGTVSPGASAGTLTATGALTFVPASNYAWEISDWTGAAGVGYDTIVADSVDFQSTSLNRFSVVITEDTLANFSEGNASFTLISTTNGITNFDPLIVVVDDTAFTSGSGTWELVVSGNDLVLEYTGGDEYLAWETTNGIAGAGRDVDSDGDGVDNGIEFVIGGDPNGTDSNNLLPTATVDATNMVFTFRQTQDSAGEDVYVEYGDNLVGWTEAEAGVGGVTINTTTDGFEPGVDRVEVTIPRVLFTGSTGFARLVNQAP
ncbi:beta strand repeat-containing protein [Haloferula rosea]|uniref:Autotransporter-associated beta strand repeat-containing protein n=1 Tax=Haloferula rosea TaxID=490093 RepID=A0A934R7M2_9BACT|nr:autotransporter-associated beta strand repeat-containing protein [Haloferula rosea]MBK1825757.1 autotransporter-associated beta strand repeat-containing protein [Haloferula rosea]